MEDNTTPEPQAPAVENAGRREFAKKAAYVAPAIVSLAVAPSYAKAGSEKPTDNYPPPPSDPLDPQNPCTWQAWLDWLKKVLGIA